MTRLGWGILTVFLLLGGLFAATLSVRVGGPAGAGQEVPAAVPDVGAATPTLRIPVAGVAAGAIGDTWGDARDGGARAHHGTDIAAPVGTSVVAAAAGRVEKLFESAAGGTTVYVRSPDGRWSYYYAHLAGYAPGLHEGQAVRAGEPLGFVGDTGNAGRGNTHLHFGVSRMRAGDGWAGGEPVNPFPMLAPPGTGG